MGMVAAGHARAVPGNHENKLVRALRGRHVQATHGLETTLAQLDGEPPAFRAEVERFCDGLVSHLVLDSGRLVVAHAGLKEAYQGRASGRVRSFALYGDTTGETDEFGLPVRYPWAREYRGLLATEGSTWADHDHGWHLELADRLVAAAPTLLRTTRRLVVDTTEPASVEAGTRWWEELTAAGGEGMVVKPLANLVRTARGVAPSGIKARGREYLRIIYGPDYTERANLDRLRARSLGHKRSLAAREYALGVESLERAARGDPLRRVHEPVFAVLALESEPVDPRL